MREEVGIRELRQNLSIYLRRVANGERFTITDHNRPVGRLDPVQEDDDPWERLLSGPDWTRPTGNLLDVEPAPMDPNDPYAATRILEELREERLP